MAGDRNDGLASENLGLYFDVLARETVLLSWLLERLIGCEFTLLVMTLSLSYTAIANEILRLVIFRSDKFRDGDLLSIAVYVFKFLAKSPKSVTFLFDSFIINFVIQTEFK